MKCKFETDVTTVCFWNIVPVSPPIDLTLYPKGRLKKPSGLKWKIPLAMLFLWMFCTSLEARVYQTGSDPRVQGDLLYNQNLNGGDPIDPIDELFPDLKNLIRVAYQLQAKLKEEAQAERKKAILEIQTELAARNIEVPPVVDVESRASLHQESHETSPLVTASVTHPMKVQILPEPEVRRAAAQIQTKASLVFVDPLKHQRSRFKKEEPRKPLVLPQNLSQVNASLQTSANASSQALDPLIQNPNFTIVDEAIAFKALAQNAEDYNALMIQKRALIQDSLNVFRNKDFTRHDRIRAAEEISAVLEKDPYLVIDPTILAEMKSELETMADEELAGIKDPGEDLTEPCVPKEASARNFAALRLLAANVKVAMEQTEGRKKRQAILHTANDLLQKELSDVQGEMSKREAEQKALLKNPEIANSPEGRAMVNSNIDVICDIRTSCIITGSATDKNIKMRTETIRSGNATVEKASKADDGKNYKLE
ncbi:MAG: hypothetical protein HY390_06355 [Deltaproteobacteria bacterium]|nr:hypothetical protein [Deltaproteobacteria bacterium]